MTSPRPTQQPQSDRDEAEIRNWMLPLKQQEFRVPDPSDISLPEDPVDWAKRLFLLEKWFRSVAKWMACLAFGIMLFYWTVRLLS